jgi:succinate dehydrogenase / fumarate reductase, membrane anchor subunit
MSRRLALAEFLVQRLTSLYLAGFTVYLVVRLVACPLADHAAWTAYFAGAWTRLAWAVFFASLLAHAWVGLRSIYMDYLHAAWLRASAEWLTAFALIAFTIWSTLILIRGPV